MYVCSAGVCGACVPIPQRNDTKCGARMYVCSAGVCGACVPIPQRNFQLHDEETDSRKFRSLLKFLWQSSSALVCGTGSA